MALRDLLVNLGVGVDDSALDRVEGKLKGVVGLFENAGKIFAGAFAAHELKEFLAGQIELGSQINDTSERLGVSAQELQKFQYAAQLSGIGAEEAATSLGFLNKNIGLAITGSKEQAQAFQEAGIQLKNADGTTRSASDVMADAADHVAALGDTAKATAFTTKLFGRAGAQLLPLLNQGSEGVAKLNDEFTALGGGLDDEFVANADKAGDEIDKLKFAFRGLKSRIAAEFLPGITKAATWLSHFVAHVINLTRHTNILRTGLLALGAGGAIAAISKLAKVFGLTGTSALDTVKNLLKFGPILLILGALYLIFDDLYTLMTGGESVIGETLDQMFGIGSSQALIDQLRKSWEEIQAAFSAMLPDLKEAGKALFEGFVAALPYIIQGFVFIVKVVTAFVDLLSGAVQSIVAIGKAVANWDFSGLGDVLGKTIDKAGNKVFGQGGIFGSEPTKLTDLPAWKEGVTAHKADAGTLAGIAPIAGVTQTNQTTIQITATGNPQELGKAVAGGVKDANADNRNALAALGVAIP